MARGSLPKSLPTPTGDGAISFVVDYGDGSPVSSSIKTGGSVKHTFKEGNHTKLYEKFGPVNVDAHVISNDFKKVEIVEKLDKVKARKAAISAFKAGEDMPPGIDINLVKRVKRT